jgi:hypothetical protein
MSADPLVCPLFEPICILELGSDGFKTEERIGKQAETVGCLSGEIMSAVCFDLRVIVVGGPTDKIVKDLFPV